MTCSGLGESVRACRCEVSGGGIGADKDGQRRDEAWRVHSARSAECGVGSGRDLGRDGGAAAASSGGARAPSRLQVWGREWQRFGTRWGQGPNWKLIQMSTRVR